MVGQPWDFFGNRDIDVLHDWGTDLLEYDLPANLETFIATQKQLNQRDHGQEIVRPDMLNEGQRRVYDYILNDLSNTIELDAPRPENVIVMGKGGVGKSFLIRAMEHGFWQLMMARYGRDEYPNVRTAVKLAAFTGKAAFQVGGVTIHSLLGLRPHDVGSAQPLSSDALRRVQEALKNTRFLFIDEMSMVGLKLLYAIDARLRQIFPHNSDEPFGGLTVVLFGDFGQLPPVMDTPLYASVTDPSKATLQHASRLYRNCFRRVFELTQQMRQQGLTENDVLFQTALTNLRIGRVQVEDWAFLQTRVLTQLSPQERADFDNAPALFSTNEEVNERNIHKLEEVGTPVARIDASYVGISAQEGAKVDSENCNGLEHVVYLSVGCRVNNPLHTILIVGDVDNERLASQRTVQRRHRDRSRAFIQRKYPPTVSTSLRPRRI